MNFKKQFLFYLTIVFIIQSCAMAETYNPPETIFLEINTKEIEKVSVGFRHPKKVVNSVQNGNLFTIDVPRMD